MEQARGAYREAPRRALDAARPLLRIGPRPVAIIRDLESRPNCPRSRPRAAATASRPELLSDYQQLIQDLKQKLGLLQARQVPPVGDPAPAQQSQTPATASPAANTASDTFPAKITAWAQIITKEEGANPTLHNPGNLKYSSLTELWGATPGPAAEDGGNLCQFVTEEAGLNALCNFLVLGCQDQLIAFHAPAARTLEGFTVVYAGNPPQGYIDAIVAAMGVPSDTQISSFLS